MAKRRIRDILSQVQHRPYSLTAGPWAYYQEWNEALFLHWKVPVAELNKLLPAGLEADCFEGEAWISLVPFRMQRIRPRHLPALKWLSDFREINLRTYVCREGRPGVYFLNIGAGKRTAALLARWISGLPYEPAVMDYSQSGAALQYQSRHREFALEVVFRKGEVITEKTALDKWLTERYCLYGQQGGQLYRFDIHHEEWPLRDVDLLRLNAGYRIGNISTAQPPDLAHYSEGVRVLAWNKVRLPGPAWKAP